MSSAFCCGLPDHTVENVWKPNTHTGIYYTYILFYTYFWFHVSFKSFNSVTTRTVGKGLPLPITWSLTRSLMRSPVSRAWNRAVPWSSQIVDSWTSIWKHTMDQRRNISKSWAPSDAGIGLFQWLEQDEYVVYRIRSPQKIFNVCINSMLLI